MLTLSLLAGSMLLSAFKCAEAHEPGPLFPSASSAILWGAKIKKFNWALGADVATDAVHDHHVTRRPMAIGAAYAAGIRGGATGQKSSNLLRLSGGAKSPDSASRDDRVNLIEGLRTIVTLPFALLFRRRNDDATAKPGASAEPAATSKPLADSVVSAVIPEKPYLRALGILALGALGTRGLHEIDESDAFRSPSLVPFLEPWQILTLVAYVMNSKVISIKGRLDGRAIMEEPQTPETARFFTPAGWAFAIWAPIFLGEALYVFFQLLVSPMRRHWWLKDMSPWYAGAMLFQVLWCFSFRRWASEAGLLWLPALMLGSTAVALGGVHALLRVAWVDKEMNLLEYFVIHLPISLHFGWISCATLVNTNGYISSVAGRANRLKLVASVLSVVLAVLLGAAISLTREDPVYAAVIAWALWAVGSKAGWKGLEGIVDPAAIRTQEVVAKSGSVVSATVAILPPLLKLVKALFTKPYDAAYNDSS